MPSDFVLKSMNNIHRTILKVSGGRKGWNAGNMPVLKLTTVGRKSGEKREVMLTSPLQLDSTMVIVASRGGDDHHPAWFLNLRDEPLAEVATQDETKHQRRARIATAEERNAMWPQIVERYKNYGGYQSRTQREIPLVLLEKIG
jgi:deazaflavin-dependent oxidoreductase (nitroreductase family)